MGKEPAQVKPSESEFQQLTNNPKLLIIPNLNLLKIPLYVKH